VGCGGRPPAWSVIYEFSPSLLKPILSEPCYSTTTPTPATQINRHFLVMEFFRR
jgi:hypothetical protein